MLPANPTTACPHCGGTSGFITNLTLKARRISSWDGRDIFTEDITTATETNPTCADCERPVRALFRPKLPQ